MLRSSLSFGDEATGAGSRNQNEFVSTSVSDVPRLVGHGAGAEFDLQNGICSDGNKNLSRGLVPQNLGHAGYLHPNGFRLNGSFLSFDFVGSFANELALIFVCDVFDHQLLVVAPDQDLLAWQHLEPCVPRSWVSFCFAIQHCLVIHLCLNDLGGTNGQYLWSVWKFENKKSVERYSTYMGFYLHTTPLRRCLGEE